MEHIAYYEKDNAQRILTYITSFLLIMGNGVIYTHASFSGHLDAVVTFLPAALLLLKIAKARFFSVESGHKTTRTVVFLLFYLTFYLICSSSNLRIAITELVLVIVFVAYYLLYERVRAPYILIAYRDIILIVCLCSLFFWFFGSILGLITPNSTVISNWGADSTGRYYQLKSYYMLYFELDKTYIFGSWVTCNRAFFVERSFAAFSFSIGWLFELFLEKQPSRFRLIVFTIAMISTVSITALIVSMITFVIYYIFNGSNDRIRLLFRIVLIPLIIYSMYIYSTYLIETKMSVGHSAISRMNDFINGFKLWIQYPVFGLGFGNAGEINRQYRTGYSNSITAVLSQGGLYLFILYIIPFFKAVHDGINNKQINKSLFAVVFFLEISFTAIAFTNTTIYVLLFLLYGMATLDIRRDN